MLIIASALVKFNSGGGVLNILNTIFYFLHKKECTTRLTDSARKRAVRCPSRA